MNMLTLVAIIEVSSIRIVLFSLAFLGDTEQMEAWKKAGVSFNVSDAHGRTPLHVVRVSQTCEVNVVPIISI